MIVSRKSAFWWGVRKLLEGEPECEVVAWETANTGALARLRELRPDVILVEQSDDDPRLGALTTSIIGAGAGRSVIALSLSDNALSVYGQGPQVVGELDDLLRVIADLGAWGHD